jgi:ubiquinone/menaquinone biosynthesis C-methylase UbiE
MSPSVTGYAYDNDSTHAVDHHSALSMLLDGFSQRRISDLIDLPGSRCAEVAAGAGAMAVWLAGQVGHEGTVLATDLKPRLIPDQEGLAILAHDITTGPLPEGPYDLVHARLLLNHLPRREQAVANMVASLVPGGVLVTEDFRPREVSEFVLRATDDQAVALLRRFHAAHMELLTRHGNDRRWSQQAADVFGQQGLAEVEVREFAGEWPGGGPGCLLMTATATQLHNELLGLSFTEAEVARVVELLHDPETVLNGHVLYSTSGRKVN